MKAFFLLLIKKTLGTWTLNLWVITLPARNIPGTFTECYLSVAMFGTSREHLGNILKEKIF